MIAALKTLLPILLLVVAGTGGAADGEALCAEPPPEPREIKITAQRFHFTPSRVQLRLGERVKFVLESRDTFHGFQILDTEINELIPARGRGSVEVLFEPEKSGRYKFQCSKKCGAGHTRMNGEIVVKSRAGEPE